ncbi:hypothetical protein NECAME_02129 [Necator americanus]|uniref:Pao retrotransposon peptidase n=1 Tax=Necator americanus TaxID=51031 RepID=W2TIN9_NECAM|nr:hypothetical protein NECAME_02129 [Necator americanus]ETN81449.1 hypothetical protein NECAME_02129 [Necator americanus]
MTNPARHSDLVELVERFWSNEFLGIVDNPNQSDDDKCLENFNNSIKYNKQERRYSVKFPFEGNPSELPTNRDRAFSRFLSNLKALQKNSEYMTKYHEIFTDQLKRGIIEEIDEGQSANISHYLAHHGVISGSKKHRKDARMNIRDYVSNNQELNRFMEEQENSKVDEQCKILGVTWDESLPQHLLEKWTQIIESWTLSSVTFPRLLIQDNAPDAKYDIHVFSDASRSAYSASSYLLEKINGHPERAMLLVSKSRLAPKKPLMTIPKLELSGLLIGSAI